MAITPKQKAVFEYIKDYIVENEFSPTFEEIAYHFKYKSKGTVYKHIKALKLKGLVRQEWNRFLPGFSLEGNSLLSGPGLRFHLGPQFNQSACGLKY